MDYCWRIASSSRFDWEFLSFSSSTTGSKYGLPALIRQHCCSVCNRCNVVRCTVTVYARTKSCNDILFCWVLTARCWSPKFNTRCPQIQLLLYKNVHTDLTGTVFFFLLWRMVLGLRYVRSSNKRTVECRVSMVLEHQYEGAEHEHDW